MRATMDYMVGNTAIQIRSSKNKITVIDVRKEKVRKSILKHLLAALVITGLLILLCFYVVRLENRKVMLDKSVYALQSQVDDMIKGNIVLQKEEESLLVDYDTIYKKALMMGMKFPKKQQVGTYDMQKSTAVRMSKTQAAETDSAGKADKKQYP